VHERAAVRTERAEVSRGVCDRQVFRDAGSRLFRRSAFEAVHVTWRARPLAAHPAALKVFDQVRPMNERWPSSVDWPQSLFDPEAHGVFVFTEKSSDLLHGIATVDLN
jgi:hypothetical protein